MESAAPQTPVQALEALQNAYSRFLDALPEARRASLGEAIGFFLRSDGNPKLGSLVDAFAEELPVHVEALKTRLAACPAEEADRLATQALELVRGLADLNIVGYDVVEVSPPYDPTGITSIAAAGLMQEFISHVAYKKKNGIVF